MNKEQQKTKKMAVNKSRLILIGVVIVIIIVAIVIVANLNKGPKAPTEVQTQLNTEIWIGKNENASLKNGEDTITLTVNSELNYVEGEELEVPYVLKVNDSEYSGTYTFATGYSIHSEPNSMPYRVNFLGIEEGKIGAIIYKDDTATQNVEQQPAE